ncbi:hypothetical protein P3T20_002280 [Paraburkholderia sp. GAS206C]|uniref:hypothetical protein n=1 Tax=unclassified Paraburkholderia TaxID=2615204 RepID=UPI003D24F523
MISLILVLPCGGAGPPAVKGIGIPSFFQLRAAWPIIAGLRPCVAIQAADAFVIRQPNLTLQKHVNSAIVIVALLLSDGHHPAGYRSLYFPADYHHKFEPTLDQYFS